MGTVHEMKIISREEMVSVYIFFYLLAKTRGVYLRIQES